MLSEPEIAGRGGACGIAPAPVPPPGNAISHEGEDLFFLPGLGGEDEATRRLTALLSGSFNVHVLEHRDLDRPCSEIFALDACIAEIASHAIAASPLRGVVFAGYSIGGVIAYEAACKLVRQGGPAPRVLLFDSSARLPDDKPFYFARQALRASRRRLVLAWSDLLLLLFISTRQPDLLRRLIPRDAKGRLAGRAMQMRKKLLLYLWRTAVRHYRPTRSGIDVTLFAAETARTGVSDPARGWSDAVQDLRIVDLCGNHWTMLQDPWFQLNRTRILAALAARAPTLGISFSGAGRLTLWP